MSKNFKIISTRKDRLGARLSNMVAAWDFALKVEAPLTVHWEDYALYHEGSYRLFDFFDERIVEHSPGRVMFDFRPRGAVYAEYGLCKDISINSHMHKSRKYFHDLDQIIWFDRTKRYYLDEPDGYYRKSLERKIFVSLPLNADVKACVDAVSDELRLEDAVSVHIRRGDILQALGHMGGDLSGPAREKEMQRHVANFVIRYAPTEAYCLAIDTVAEGRNLVLFSDDDAARASLYERYGSRVLDVHSRLDRFDLTAGQRAFAEMLLIAKTQQAICSLSAFSNFAISVGGRRHCPVFGFIRGEDLVGDVNRVIAGRADTAEIFALLRRQYEILFNDRMPPQDGFFDGWADVADRPEAARRASGAS